MQDVNINRSFSININSKTMKKLILFILVVFPMTKLWSQDPFLFEEPKTTEPKSIPLIGDPAPSFVAQSTNGEIKFPGDYGKSWKILFSHPQDFTPVCTTELLELANLQDQFDKLGVKILAISTDRLTGPPLPMAWPYSVRRWGLSRSVRRPRAARSSGCVYMDP